MNNPHYITGQIEIAGSAIPIVSTLLTKKDKMGAFKARFAINRNNYKVQPGLYAIGNPDSQSEVLVTANYKLSFDALRRELQGMDFWLVVLDTKGINVWCAAGKGTFGTCELIGRIKKTELEKIVDHRRLILPQLGAPGVCAHEVKRKTGFRVIYGPVKAADIPAFIDAGKKAAPEMRRVSFPFMDRIILIPVEFVTSFRKFVFAVALFLLLSGLDSTGFNPGDIAGSGMRALANLFLAYFSATVLGPAFLPWIPFRSFSLKGLIIVIPAVLLSLFSGLMSGNLYEIIAWLLLMSSISSFLLMNFTGASTFTSLSGVIKEMKFAVPMQILFALAGLTLYIIANFVTKTIEL